MYAVINCGGKQHKVAVGDVIEVEKLDLEKGAKVSFDAIFTADGETVNTKPSVKVEAEVLAQYKDKKIIVYKYKAKKNVRRKQGHRQPHTKIKILSIS